jgi:asparagine synthase (glutamine-hydrolysing)
MIAAFCGERSGAEAIERRLASTLSAFSRTKAESACIDDVIVARLGRKGPHGTIGRPRWQPERTPTGRIVLFDGWFDNLDEIAELLGCDPSRGAAHVYGLACETWGTRADARIVGHYSAIVCDGDGSAMRLARSAPAAPPLHYCTLPKTDGALVAGSVPTMLLAAGLERRLNPRKLVDSLYNNTTGDESFLDGAFRVGVGEVVELRAQERRTSRWWDPLAPRPRLRGKPEDFVEEADRLLREAARCAVAGFDKPAIQLSGGLDSTNVAARVLQVLPPDQTLPSYTFTPLGGSPGLSPQYFFCDERPMVEAFAAMHPRIVPRFTDNADRAFDSNLDRMFMATGSAPPNLAITSAFDGLFGMAAQDGCDLLLSSDLGNFTISNSGVWGYGEYLRHGKWRKLWTALRHCPHPRPLYRNFLSLSVIPHLPDALLSRWQRQRGAQAGPVNDGMAFIRPEALERHDVTARARDANVLYERTRHARRETMLRDQWGRGDCDSADTLNGFHQLHGVAWRDVTAYRPLVEFCLALPTEAFLNDGQNRWLARALGRGIMPEGQRLERRHGFQQSDWHRRLTPRVGELRAEVERARDIAEVDELIDLDRLARQLDEWPEHATLDYDVFDPCALGVPRAITAIRYIRFIGGHNAG